MAKSLARYLADTASWNRHSEGGRCVRGVGGRGGERKTTHREA